jgi:tRNA nucleotidyltransferase (CCA-adding enzyme)
MAEPLLGHAEIAGFAENRVNLPTEKANEYREQVNRLRERLAAHIAQNPGFALVKMLHAGSVAKGTALRTINDLDVAVYLKKERIPIREAELVPWLAERLREANPNLKPDQFDDSQPHCVTIRFRGSGLDVDVVPVLYEGDANDVGYLVDRHTGDRLRTSIPLHLEFIRKRKRQDPVHWAQVVRLLKWWAAGLKANDDGFKCKSFMIELIVAHYVDNGQLQLTDYPRALESFFSRVVKTGLQGRIAFTDYYRSTQLHGPTGVAIEIIDPVNPDNNVAGKYTAADRERLTRAAEDAADAISEAYYATTKGRAIECWQIVLGPGFRG